MIESKKVKGKAKSVVLPNGREVTYCERGENNPEVLITGAFYFHTFMPVVEYMAERYHVYGIVMAVSGESLCKDTEGNTHWGNTWGEDLYGFVKALGIEKFHYLGKCHGVVPGWWMVRHHPEMLTDFCSFLYGSSPETADGKCLVRHHQDQRPPGAAIDGDAQEDRHF